ncbi:MAG: zinc ribbon domain-containing protein [Ruminococcus sp.]|nr:zinc ribbon domain-containing protein [Ruminococcus sp.]
MGKFKCSDCGFVFSDSERACPKCFSETYTRISDAGNNSQQQSALRYFSDKRTSGSASGTSGHIERNGLPPDPYYRNQMPNGYYNNYGSKQSSSNEISPRTVVFSVLAVFIVIIGIIVVASKGGLSGLGQKSPKEIALSTAKKEIETVNKQQSGRVKISEPKVLSNTGNVYYIYAESTSTYLDITQKQGLMIVVRVKDNKGEVLQSGMTGDNMDTTLEFYKKLYDSYAN